MKLASTLCCLCALCLVALPSVMRGEERKLKVVIMEIEDKTGTFDANTIEQATEYLRGKFVASGRFVVIAKDRQRKVLVKEMKKESWKDCYDQQCQITLGQALAADTVVTTTISRLSGRYTLIWEMIDLSKEATMYGDAQSFTDRNEIAAVIDRATIKLGDLFLTTPPSPVADEPKSESVENVDDTKATEDELEEQAREARAETQKTGEKQKEEMPSDLSLEESFRYKTEWFSLRGNIGNFGGGGSLSFFTLRWRWMFWEIAGASAGAGWGGGADMHFGWYAFGTTKLGVPFFLSQDNRHEIRLSFGFAGGLIVAWGGDYEESDYADGYHEQISFLNFPFEFSYLYHFQDIALQMGFELSFPWYYKLDDLPWVPFFNVFFGFRI